MNIEEFKALRDFIAGRPGNEFNMGAYLSDYPHDDFLEKDPKELLQCGTVACIAGDYALMRANSINYSLDVADGVTIEAFSAKGLGLDKEQAERLFYGRWYVKSRMEDITKEMALEYLDKCIDAGKLV